MNIYRQYLKFPSIKKTLFFLIFLTTLFTIGGKVLAQSPIALFNFEDGTLQGWNSKQMQDWSYYKQIDKQIIGDIRFSCENAYPFELSLTEGKDNTKGIKIGPEKELGVIDCKVGIIKMLDVNPESDILISFDARTVSDDALSTDSNVELHVYGGAEIPDDYNEIGLSYYNQYTKNDNPQNEKMLFPPKYGMGVSDSGWENYSLTVNSQNNPQISIFIDTHDHWVADIHKILYIDNVKVVDIGYFSPIILEMNAIVNQLSVENIKNLGVDYVASAISQMSAFINQLNNLLIQYQALK